MRIEFKAGYKSEWLPDQAEVDGVLFDVEHTPDGITLKRAIKTVEAAAPAVSGAMFFFKAGGNPFALAETAVKRLTAELKAADRQYDRLLDKLLSYRG